MDIRVGFLFPDDLHQHSLAPPTVELAVENLLSRAEVQIPIRHRHHHLPPHHLALEMRVGVVLAGAVVPIMINGFMGGKPFQPGVIVVVKTTFVKIDQMYTKPDDPFRL